jgi:hypothetical protein
MPDNKPVAAQEAVEAYKTLRRWCNQFVGTCGRCPFKNDHEKFASRCMIQQQVPEDWRDVWPIPVKEAPHA